MNIWLSVWWEAFVTGIRWTTVCVCGFSNSYSLGVEADIDHVCLNYSGGNSVGVFPRVTEVGFYWICLSLNRGFLSAEEPTSELCFIL